MRRLRTVRTARATGLALAALAAAALAGRPTAAHAQITLSFSGTPATFVVSGATAGAAPPSVVSGVTTWGLLGVWLVKPRITAQLATALPPGVTLEVSMTAPIGATSMGWVALSTTARDVVRDLPLVAISGMAVQYRFTATPAAGVIPLSSRSVTFTAVFGS